jgi:hypothetical protein
VPIGIEVNADNVCLPFELLSQAVDFWPHLVATKTAKVHTKLDQQRPITLLHERLEFSA